MTLLSRKMLLLKRIVKPSKEEKEEKDQKKGSHLSLKRRGSARNDY